MRSGTPTDPILGVRDGASNGHRACASFCWEWIGSFRLPATRDDEGLDQECLQWDRLVETAMQRHAQHVNTAAPVNRPARKSSSAWLACPSG